MNPNLKIEWDEVPDEIKEAVEKDLSKFLWLTPPWLQELSIFYKARLDKIAESETNYRYRWAIIIIGASYLTHDDSGRRDAIIHELIHVVLAPPQHIVDRLLVDANSFEKDTYNSGLEEVVCDLTHVIKEKL